MAGNKVSVSLLILPNNGFELAPSPGVDLPIGQFPEGQYEVEVTKRSSSGATLGSVGNVAFTVAGRSQSDPLWDNSDIWWSPSESGWGLNIVQHSSGVIFATWLVYGPDNKPVWYVIPEGSWTSPSEYRGPIYRTSGPFFAGPFDPANVALTLVGSAIIGFDPFHYDRAGIAFTIDGITIVKQIRRQ
jgi:hypothetical protein